MSATSVGVVRTAWSFEVARACQRFAGRTLDPDPEELLDGVDELAQGLPEGQTPLERIVLRERLRTTAESAGRQFHAQFHRLVSRECHDALSRTPRALAWDDLGRPTSQLLVEWVTGFLDEFATMHPWPASMRAARLIRGSFERPLNVDRIARAVGLERSGLSRSFKDAYGISMGNYHTRCRVRFSLQPLRTPDSNVGEIAFHVGYRSTKNFYRALRELTGMTPSQVRRLTDEGADRVLNTQLRLPAWHDLSRPALKSSGP